MALLNEELQFEMKILSINKHRMYGDYGVNCSLGAFYKSGVIQVEDVIIIQIIIQKIYVSFPIL